MLARKGMIPTQIWTCSAFTYHVSLSWVFWKEDNIPATLLEEKLHKYFLDWFLKNTSCNWPDRFWGVRFFSKAALQVTVYKTNSPFPFDLTNVRACEGLQSPRRPRFMWCCVPVVMPSFRSHLMSNKTCKDLNSWPGEVMAHAGKTLRFLSFCECKTSWRCVTEWSSHTLQDICTDNCPRVSSSYPLVISVTWSPVRKRHKQNGDECRTAPCCCSVL